ncbi:MAG: hypothetical protein HW383_25 [Candidatus Magasanikbacteria bacterium]|nr:hypothetical protein [Candidatus Magasanikbacteria bacterium]
MTMLEIILVLILFMGLVLSIFPSFFGWFRASYLDAARYGYVNALRRAQYRAFSQDRESAWGVDITTSTITLFRGTNFATRNTDFDETTDLSAVGSLSGPTRFIFQTFTGKPDTTGTTTIQATDGTSLNISVNGYGRTDF